MSQAPRSGCHLNTGNDMIGPRGHTGPVAPIDTTLVSLPFCPEVHTSAIPEALHNEPFAFVDNQQRMSRSSVIQRPRFKFDISQEGMASCVIGDRHINSGYMVSGVALPVKRKSNVSILTVYDEYGFETARMFLEHLCSRVDAAEWILTYLRGSLLAMQSDEPDITQMHQYNAILYLSKLILDRLSALEAAQPRAIGELTPSGVEFPIDILCAITRDASLSSQIRDRVLGN